METRVTFLIGFISFFLLQSCTENTEKIVLENEIIIISASEYEQTTTNSYTITNVKQQDNLLTIKISSSGCSGESWQAILIDSSFIVESQPIQRFLKLRLDNTEACLAVFEREFTFDISVLKESYSNIILNLEGWENTINI